MGTYYGGLPTTFKIGSAPMSGTPTYSTVGQVQKIGDYTVEAIMAEVTAHDSPGGFEEKIPTGLFKVSDVELEIGYDPGNTTHSKNAGGLIHALLNKTLLAYQIVLPDTNDTTWTFDAYVRKLSQTVDKDKEVKLKATLGITGQPTITDSA